MNIITISDEIQKKITELDNIRKELIPRGKSMVDTLVEYERILAITMIKLKNGVEFELDGEKIKNPPASYLKDIAKGICFKEKITADASEIMYKSIITNLTVCQSQLTGLQTINKHLDKA